MYYKLYGMHQCITSCTECTNVLQVVRNAPMYYKLYGMHQCITSCTECTDVLQVVRNAPMYYKLYGMHQCITSCTECTDVLQVVRNAPMYCKLYFSFTFCNVDLCPMLRYVMPNIFIVAYTCSSFLSLIALVDSSNTVRCNDVLLTVHACRLHTYHTKS